MSRQAQHHNQKPSTVVEGMGVVCCAARIEANGDPKGVPGS
jgi:hypothetical protein